MTERSGRLPDAATHIPFVELTLNGRTIDLIDASTQVQNTQAASPRNPPQNRLLLVDFSYTITKRLGVGNDLQLTILDPQWDYLEGILIETVNLASFGLRYGWRGKKGAVSSPRIELVLTDWEVELSPFQGAILKIRGMDRSVLLNNEAATFGFKSTTLVSGAIAAIIRTIPGLSPSVERTANTIGQDNTLNNRTPMQYLRDLIEIAKSATGGRNEYVATVTPNSGGSLMRVGNDSVKKRVAREYVFGRERQGKMFSFKPQYLGIQILQTGGNETVGKTVNAKKKTVEQVKTTQTEDDIEDRSRPIARQGVNRIIESAQDLSATEGFAKRTRTRATHPVYSATATILGDPKLDVLDQVRIKVFKFQQVKTTDDLLHHVSGVYRIDAITHTIAAGLFRTNLELFRAAARFGAVQEGNQVATEQVDPEGPVDSVLLDVNRLPSRNRALERELLRREAGGSIGIV